MLTVSRDDIDRRIRQDNPWWSDADVSIEEGTYPRRIYFDQFQKIALDRSLKRATVLLGPRRVGKTVMAKQLVLAAIEQGFPSDQILYASVDTPAYAGMPLERFIGFLPKKPEEKALVIFDEIQYLKQWEVHLKDLVDSYPKIKFVATGSAAAALRVQSKESGAGRFTDFVLPPLTFYEFLLFTERDKDLIDVDESNERVKFLCSDLDSLNAEFINYLNYGGYPEVALNERVRGDAARFVKNDIIDKVLLKDLPSLYGINDIQELNRLFTVLAYNTGGEVNLQSISQESGLSKPTIQKYLIYLESAFLILRVSTVNENCRSMKRARNFKVYLNNPSMRAALFSPVSVDEADKVGHLCEAAIFSQWQHSNDFQNLRYARWQGGEVDMVYLDSADQKPVWAGEIKWSDRVESSRSVLRNMSKLCGKNRSIRSLFVTSRTLEKSVEVEGIEGRVVPSALHCYTVGRNVTRYRVRDMGLEFGSLD